MTNFILAQAQSAPEGITINGATIFAFVSLILSGIITYIVLSKRAREAQLIKENEIRDKKIDALEKELLVLRTTQTSESKGWDEYKERKEKDDDDYKILMKELGDKLDNQHIFFGNKFDEISKKIDGKFEPLQKQIHEHEVEIGKLKANKLKS